MSIKLVEGWTGAVDFRLEADGAAIDLTDVTVTLILTGADGVAIDTAGDVSVVLPASSGVVRYDPDAADLTAAKSPYRARWKLDYASGDTIYVPSNGRDTWDVEGV